MVQKDFSRFRHRHETLWNLHCQLVVVHQCHFVSNVFFIVSSTHISCYLVHVKPCSIISRILLSRVHEEATRPRDACPAGAT